MADAVTPDIEPDLPPSDPLGRLGDSLTLQILGYLPLPELLRVSSLSKAYSGLYTAHSAGIFRTACRRFDIDTETVNELHKREQAPSSRCRGQAGQLNDAADGASEAVSQRVDWREELRKHIIRDANWKHGRCREWWINSSRKDVWRFCLDPEEGTCITTTRSGRLEVVDADSSAPLFIIDGLEREAQLDFANGFVVFTSVERPTQLEVWRTRHAISRSLHPEPFGETKETHSTTCVEDPRGPRFEPVSTQPCGVIDAARPLARGGLGFYRILTPPTECSAFRVRTDFAGTVHERTVACIAGDEGVYVYDVEHGTFIQEYILPSFEFDLTRYSNSSPVDLDDENIILCSGCEVYLISRETNRLLLALPEYFDISGHTSSRKKVIYDMDRTCGNTSTDQLNEHDAKLKPIPASDARLGASMTTKLSPSRILEQCIGEQRLRFFDIYDPDFRPWYRAFAHCRHAGNDLIYAGDDEGKVFVPRRYRSVLQIDDALERRRTWFNHTVELVLNQERDDDDEKVYSMALATSKSHAVFSSYHCVFSIDTSTLPDMCHDDGGICRACSARIADSRITRASVSEPALDLANGPILCAFKPRVGQYIEDPGYLQADKNNIYAWYGLASDGNRRPWSPLERDPPHHVDDAIKALSFAA